MLPPPVPVTDADLEGAVRLSDWGLIRAQGDDARSFLHGQLTQDVIGLEAGHARLAGYCSAKGRLLASFVLWSPAPDSVLLACSADLLQATLKRLSMFVLRSKCKLSDASAEFTLWGLAGRAAADWLGDWSPGNGSLGEGSLGDDWTLRTRGDNTFVRLPDAGTGAALVPRWLRAAPAGAATPELRALAPSAWAWLEATSGVARIVAATSEQFVPQMVNLDLVGGVNFQKGCYPGQEVVARSQYRGTLKRRAQVLTSAEPLAPGDEVFHSADPGQPAGRVALAGSRGAQQHAALVELKLAALAGGSLHLGAADGPLLQLAALPYALPSDAA